MSLKSIVKVSHLSNLSDARFCSGMGVELLGFGAIPGTETYMPPAVFHEIRGWIAGPGIVAEIYGITSVDQLHEVMQTYAPNYLELSWDEYTMLRNHLSLPSIVHVSNLRSTIAASKDSGIVYVTTDEQTACSDISGIAYPVLGRVQSVEELHKKMKAGCFAGYVLESPRQVRTGVTSYDQLGEILEALEEE